MARRKDVEGQQSLGLEKGMVLSRDISGNKQARRLIALYKEAEKDITRKLLEMNGSTANARLMATQKKAIDAILKALRKRGTTIAEAMVEASYRGGFRSGRDELIQAGLADAEVRPRMGSIHTRALEVYSSQVLSRLSDVNTTAGRTVQDIYDQLQLNTVLSGALAGTETLTQVQRKMERLAADGGVTAFVDKSGRAWSMATYTEMLARTTTMQVYNKAKEIEFREHDEDLILVSTHYPTCDMCAPWNGAVLSLTGKTEGYRTLDEAESDGLFHPNCRHTFSLFIAGTNVDGGAVGNALEGPEDNEGTEAPRTTSPTTGEFFASADIDMQTERAKELGALLVGITDGQRKSYVIESVKRAPEDLYKVFRRFAKDLKYEAHESKSYNNGNTIFIFEKGIPQKIGKADQNGLLSMIQHELGHYIDHKLAEERGCNSVIDFYSHLFGGISNAADKDRYAKSPIWGAPDEKGNYPDKLKKVLELCGDKDAPYRNKMLFSDLFDNLLSGVDELKWNHGKQYYGLLEARRPTELFANLTAIYARQNPQEIEFVKSYMPETWDAYTKIIREVAENGS